MTDFSHAPTTPLGSPPPLPSPDDAAASKKKKRLKIIAIAVGIFVAIGVVGAIAGGNRETVSAAPETSAPASSSAKPVASSPAAVTPTPTPRIDVVVPDLAGLTVAEARTVIGEAKLVLQTPSSSSDTHIVLSQAPAAGETILDGDEVAVVVAAQVTVPHIVGSTLSQARSKVESLGLVFEAPAGATDSAVVATQSVAADTTVLADTAVAVTVEPERTLAQKNAIGKAKSYLSFMGFSRQGLIEQLEFEGFSNADATFGADNAGADWNAECAEKAASYLEFMSFSRDGLYDQLEFEGFTHEQIEFGLTSVGY